MGIDGALAIENSLNVVFLSKLATEREVGLYSAATQLMVPLVLVYQSIAQSIFPVMCRKVEPGLRALRRIAEQASEGLLMLALPTVAGILFLGQWALSILYKNPAFLQAFPALRIVAWVLILQVFTYVLGQVLVATHREKITLRIVLVEVLLNLAAGLFLIGRFGLRGAAVTLLLTRMAGCIQHYILVSRQLSGISLAKIVWKPLLAASCMAAYFLLAPTQAGILAGVSATLIYVAALLALAILACGSIREFKARFFSMWSGSSPGRQEEVGS
jgi:O-antigen/teichoic acid export membrane protein